MPMSIVTLPILCDVTADRNCGFMSLSLLTASCDTACTFRHFDWKWLRPLHFLHTLPHAGNSFFSFSSFFALMRSATNVTALNKVLSSTLIWTQCFLPRLVGIDFPPVSPTDLWRLYVILSMCAPAISFVCLLVSSCARQTSTAFCRSSAFSRRGSSCTLSVTDNTILSRNFRSFISPKLHKFARGLKSVRNEVKGSWYVMFQNRCDFVWSRATILCKIV